MHQGAMLRARARPLQGSAASSSSSSSGRRRAVLSASETRRRRSLCSSSSLRPSQAARPSTHMAAVPEVYLPLPSDVVAQGAEAVDRHLRSAAAASSGATSTPPSSPSSSVVSGVQVDVWWGDAEPRAPGCYDLAATVAAVEAAARRGLKARVALHFHAGYSWVEGGGSADDEQQQRQTQQQDDGTEAALASADAPARPQRRRHRQQRERRYHPLPAWVRAVGARNPDIYFRDAHGGTSERECLTLGIDDVPCLAGRTAAEAYAGLARAVASALAARGLWGAAVRDVVVGLGPGGELRYPSHPQDDGEESSGSSSRWAYPCVGEFQCYDRYLLASLSAAAHERAQPHWGAAGPHDAVGGYSAPSPAQLGFFHPQGGSWSSEYGAFFLEWYGRQLVGHACRVLDAVAGATAGVVGSGPPPPPPRLHARLPAVHWWHGSPERSAELTAGYCSPPGAGEPYLDAMLALARRGVGAELAVVAPTSCCDGGAVVASSSSSSSSSSSNWGAAWGAAVSAARHPHPHAAADDPWGLLIQQRGTAAAVGVPCVTLVARPRGLGAGAAPGGGLGAAEAAAALAALAEAAATGAGADYRGVELAVPDAVSVDGAFADLWLDDGSEVEKEEEAAAAAEEEAAVVVAALAAAAAAAAAKASPPAPVPAAAAPVASLFLADEEEDLVYYDQHQARNAYGVPADLIAQHRELLEQRRRSQQPQQQQKEQRQQEPALRA